MSEPPAHADLDPDHPIVREANETARALATSRSEAHRTADARDTGDYTLWNEQYNATMERLTTLLGEGPTADALLYMATLITSLAQLPSLIAIHAYQVGGMTGQAFDEALADPSFEDPPQIEAVLRRALDPEALFGLTFQGIEAAGWQF